MTPNQFDRFARELVALSGDGSGRVVKRGSTVYYEGTEVATLRLLKAYRFNSNARQAYSTNLQTFYFTLGPDI